MDLSNEPSECPKCGSQDIYKFIPEMEPENLKIGFSCNNCKILGNAVFKVQFSHYEDNNGPLIK